MEKKYTTAAEIGKFINVPTNTIWDMARKGKIPFIKIGSRAYRFNIDAVIEALKGEA
jgi:excisionase family DNA binding protein